MSSSGARCEKQTDGRRTSAGNQGHRTHERWPNQPVELTVYASLRPQLTDTLA